MIVIASAAVQENWFVNFVMVLEYQFPSTKKPCYFYQKAPPSLSYRLRQLFNYYTQQDKYQSTDKQTSKTTTSVFSVISQRTLKNQ